MNQRRITQFVFTTSSVLAASAILINLVIASSQIDISGPIGSGFFGKSVTVLPNGNLVICDPGYDAGSIKDVGAAYLYDGADGTLISKLIGSMVNDQICNLGVTVLSSGNYLVSSPSWDNGAAWDAGAVTWGDDETGISGQISAANSLVGSSSDDGVGYSVTVLSNGNYVVSSPSWDNGAAWNVGAVTWGDGKTGITGPISTANSLVGSSSGDGVGSSVTELSNGNYVVTSPYWDNGAAWNVGAVTWVNGKTGITGPISPANSLVGSTTDDQIGLYWGVTALANGNFVVISWFWDNGAIPDAGAATWGDGTTGITGPISAANSLVGSSPGDQMGGNVTALYNGNYVVCSPEWDNRAIADAGSVTWADGKTGISGPISAANSLVGSSPGDLVGNLGVTALSNGNYVVSSSAWDNGAAWDAGAVTWGNGETGITGPVSAANSLVGSSLNDQVGGQIDYPYSSGVITLANGNYVVSNPNWDNGAVADAGAVTWVDGKTGISGPVSAANSLVGSSAGDRVGGVTSLANGNYVVISPSWDNGMVADVGAATWEDGTTGITGPISAANSLVGSSSGDQVGGKVTALSNGNYVVCSPEWDNGSVADVGAVTWANGTTGVTGPVSPANSLVGSTADDQVSGFLGATALANGNYVVSSPNWDNGSVADAGAVTWGNGAIGITGLVSVANSLVGGSPDDHVGGKFYYQYSSGAAALANGNYVVSSPTWDNGAETDAGAVTWADGTVGITSTVNAANSLVGSTAYDQVGATLVRVCFRGSCQEEPVNGISVLLNGNYVVHNSEWDNGAAADAGAFTWGDGTTGTRGPITAENSVLGGAIDGGWRMFYNYDPYNDQLLVSRLAENIVSLFRPNRAPVAQAGWPLIVARGALVQLDGIASYDPDGNLPLQFTWTQTGGPPVILSDPHAISPTFIAPNERTSLTFNLVITDALGSSSQPGKAIVFVDPYQYFWPTILEH